MEISRRVVGPVLLVSGILLLSSYFALVQTDVGAIAELVGVGFCFTVLGLLCTVGELVGVAPEEER